MIVIAKDNVERTIHLTEVKRLYFHQSHITVRCFHEQCAISRILDFNQGAKELGCVLFERGGGTPGPSVNADKPISLLREICGWLERLERQGGVVVIKKRPLESQML